MDSPEVRAAVRETDAAVGAVLAEVERIGDAALIVTTDHGMVPVTHIVNIEYILRRHAVAARIAATGTTAIVPGEEPAWSHLGAGPRSGDLIVSAKPPYAIEDRGQLPWFFRWIAWTGPEMIDTSRSLKASHGYPPDTPGVRGVYYAWGAGIRRGTAVERVDAVDSHPTVARLLGIEPGKPVDGKIARELLADGAAPTE
jgi:predicted AlkP superfamily pyrophosphatase or phosphodiesterase